MLRSPEIANILENSDFIYMLNQASDDRNILAQRLNISPHQLSYVTNSGEGEGLLFYGNVILPFVDRFPTDPARIKKLESRSFKTESGIEIKIPAELCSSDDAVEFIHSATGGLSLLIKDVLV